ncbi:PREDICTED: pentatricopeptide repeat-containing protein At3g46870-like [Nicotiana attenuata]|uniref:Pentatricopeptide repeat-containing protein n=1 Tax=Nicotiana attenuata TaxID=49451 RepID=A0A314L3K5_NICAT|nr:PREDICTED: pentatricopeptide repeat-containing protein At3g46870-like [Nicotiana attenuata]OIT35599.1 pentatricopeptide repeat-containing protein [Nicotiana attenuata]
MSTRAISRLKISSLLLVKHLSVVSPLPKISSNLASYSCSTTWVPQFSRSFLGDVRFYHDGRPRGPLWRGKKLIGKEAIFVILGLKRFKDDEEKLDKFVKTHVLRLLKMDLIAVLNELERQEEVSLAVKVFWVIQKQDWYQPDVYLYKDLIIALARRRKMDDAMKLWESMRKEDLFPDCQTFTEVIRGFLRDGSPADAMNIFEDMKKSPYPPEELPFRILLKGLLPHPLLRNRVKQDFEEIFPDRHIYDPPEEIFGLR